ncbi:MAG: glycosyltransferase family 4 protein [Chitinispirillaceae bacterium]|nr:glycosyltransferase family 4 protein [Chitinispirillaceae bacterium]
MNILFISNEYPPDTAFGGIGTYTSHAAEGLAARGHTVHVICRSVSRENGMRRQSGVTVHRIVPGPYTLPASRFFFPVRLCCYHLIPQSLVRLAWAKSVSTYLASSGLRFDIIEYPECGAEGYYLNGSGAVTVARLHTPWTLIARYDRLAEPASDRFMMNCLEKRSARNATAVTSPSGSLARLMQKKWRLPAVTVYPNPIAAASYSQTAGNGWIYTGRIERRKGIDALLRAFARLPPGSGVPRLTLLGRPYGRMKNGIEYGDYIRAMISDLGIEERTTWIPGVASHEVAAYLARSSVAFFPSLWENFPYACLEAMASGCAVVASRCGGFVEMVVDGQCGILVDPGSDTALHGAMLRLINEPGLDKKLGQAARGRVASRCDRETICARAESFYRSLRERAGHA